MTIFDVKQKAIDALGEIDLSKLSLCDLTGYVQALTTPNTIQEDKSDMFKSYLDGLSAGALNGMARPTIADLSAGK